MRNCTVTPNANSVVPKCPLCNRYGHKKEYCWEDERNAHRCPEGWRSVLQSPLADNNEDDALLSFNLMAYQVHEALLDQFIDYPGAVVDEYSSDDEAGFYSDSKDTFTTCTVEYDSSDDRSFVLSQASDDGPIVVHYDSTALPLLGR